MLIESIILKMYIRVVGFCYSLPNCVEGSEIETQTGTQIDCCIGTDDGQSYADSGGNCVVPQCIGMKYMSSYC